MQGTEYTTVKSILMKLTFLSTSKQAKKAKQETNDHNGTNCLQLELK